MEYPIDKTFPKPSGKQNNSSKQPQNEINKCNRKRCYNNTLYFCWKKIYNSKNLVRINRNIFYHIIKTVRDPLKYLSEILYHIKD